jgi:hypothetical protein
MCYTLPNKLLLQWTLAHVNDNIISIIIYCPFSFIWVNGGNTVTLNTFPQYNPSYPHTTFIKYKIPVHRLHEHSSSTIQNQQVKGTLRDDSMARAVTAIHQKVILTVLDELEKKGFSIIYVQSCTRRHQFQYKSNDQ